MLQENASADSDSPLPPTLTQHHALPMLSELFAELTEFTVLMITGYVLIHVYVSSRQSSLKLFLAKRKPLLLSLMALILVGAKVSEDVLYHESGAIDEMLMWFVKQNISPQAHSFFAALTVSGSAVVLVPVGTISVLLLVATRHRLEAALVLASLAASYGLVYVIKAMVGRARPALWETEQWYSGSSFPSGHTTSSAALSTALALCIGQIWPRWGTVAMLAALSWTALVGLSRMVLGVHWPTDVLAALCLGVLITLLLRVGVDLRAHRSAQTDGPA